MYRPDKQRRFFNKAVTKHGAGRVEKRARVALLIGIGIGLAVAVVLLLYLARLAPVLAGLLPTLVKATIIPLIIVTFYLVGVLDADEDIYKESEADDDTKT